MRKVERLNALMLKRLGPGLHADGANLFLQVTGEHARSWIFRFKRAGRTRDMGLGPLHDVSLAQARQEAREARDLLRRGTDPIEAKRAREAAARAEEAQFRSFEEEARSYIADFRAGWKNDKHASQWENTLQTYAFPFIGKLHVGAIDTPLIVKMLEPIWTTKTETATRLRGRVEKILAYSATRGFRSGENPARWRNHLDLMLPKPGDIAEVEHHPALPYAELGAFMADLRQRNAKSARALELTILCAVRTNDAIGATWKEIDLAAAIWTLPKARTKTRELRVPLVPAAMAILRNLPEGGPDDFLFTGDDGAPLSNGAMLALLERMGFGHVTVHGFRSTFKDWATDCTNFHDDISEMALAHSIGSETKKAYKRTDLFLKRRRLMEAWAGFCDKPSTRGAEVVPMRGQAS